MKVYAAEKPVKAVPSQGEKKRFPVALVAGLVVVCCIVMALLYFFVIRTESTTGTVSSVMWERAIKIEALGPVEYEDWRDEISSEGEILSCEQEVRSVQSSAPIGQDYNEVCGTPYTVDTGSGVGEVVQDCEYQVYDNKCTYTLIEWSVVDTVSTTGTDFSPVWPDPDLGTDQRLGDQSEEYQVYFNAGDYIYTTQELTEFQQFEIGSTWNLEVNALGAVVTVSR